jgi:hypothetical protein
MILSKRDRDDIRHGAMTQWGRDRSDAIFKLIVIARLLLFGGIVLAITGTWAWQRYGAAIRAIDPPEVTAPSGGLPIADGPALIWLSALAVPAAIAIAVRLARRPYAPGALALKILLAVTVVIGVAGFALGAT